MQHTGLLLLIIALLSSPFALAWDLSAQQINGTYQLLVPERSAQGMVSQSQVEYLKMGDKFVLARAHCKRCTPLVMSKMEEVSQELQRPVFFSQMGIYALAYDAKTFVFVMPKPIVMLGDKAFSGFLFVNVYSKGKPSLSLKDAQAFAIQESKRLLSGEVKAVKVDKSTFYPLVNDYVSGQKTNKMRLQITTKKQVIIGDAGCQDCPTDTYVYAPQVSQDTRQELYKRDTNPDKITRYLWRYKPNVWIKLHQPYGLGLSIFGTTDTLNVLAQDKRWLRKLRTDEALQTQLQQDIQDMSKVAKQAYDKRYAKTQEKRIAQAQLPQENQTFASFNAAFLAAAKVRATAENWQETLLKAYATGHDWQILRNKLTGIQIGRQISSIIVMRRKDGLCSYQHVHFHQQANGKDYQKPSLHSIDSGQHKLACSKIGN